jgi:hypothetical protein
MGATTDDGFGVRCSLNSADMKSRMKSHVLTATNHAQPQNGHKIAHEIASQMASPNRKLLVCDLLHEQKMERDCCRTQNRT